MCVIALALLVGDILSLRVRPQELYRITAGSGTDLLLLDGVLKTERDSDGNVYRWTTGHTNFTVRGFASVPHPILELGIGGFPRTVPAPRLVHLTLDGNKLTMPVAPEARRYHLLLPRGALLDGNLHLNMESDTSVVPPDPRALGIRLDDIALGWERDAWVLPGWQLLLVQCGVVLTWIALARSLGLPRWSWAVIAIALIVLLPIMAGPILLLAMIWVLPLFVAGLALLAMTSQVFPWLKRSFQADRTLLDPRWLGLIVIVAISLRLWAVFYPLFGVHDLLIHRQRLLNVQYGTLQLFDSPSEFAGRQAVVPPAFYLLASPVTLLFPDAGAAIQGIFTLLEGTGIFLIALLVRNVGGSWRAATIAALCIACLPIQLTALWWGFAPQIVGQWLILVLAVLITYPGKVGWSRAIVATVAFAITLLMHDGVAALGGIWLALYLMLSWLLVRHHDQNWRAWTGVVIAASVIASLLLYIDIIGMHISELATGAATPSPFTTEVRLRLLWQGLQASFRPISMFGVVGVFATLLYWTRGSHRHLIVAWLLSTTLFLLIDVAVGLQVRYGYFVTPLVCVGLALLLDRVMARGIWGKVSSWGLIAVIVCMGLQLWFEGVFWSIKPTLTALTH